MLKKYNITLSKIIIQILKESVTLVVWWISGFGPFASHKVNASWVAVQELVQIGGLGDDINLVTLEIPVAYDDVTACVPDIWKTYQPKVFRYLIFWNFLSVDFSMK